MSFAETRDKDIDTNYLPVVILLRTETRKYIKVSEIKPVPAITSVSGIKIRVYRKIGQWDKTRACHENWLVG